MIIYKLTNLINGKCYVGQTSKSLSIRWYQHVYSSIKQTPKTYLHKAIRKHGVDCWSKEILENCSNKLEMEKRELFWILETKKQTHIYNLTSDTSTTARPWTDEEKLTRFKYSKPEKIICLNNKKIYVSIREASKDLNLNYSSIRSVLSGVKNSIKGYVFEYLNPEKRKLAEEKKNKRVQNRLLRNSIGIKVINLSTGEVFKSIKQASRALGVPESTIGRFLKEKHGFGGNLNLSYMEKQ